MDYWLFNADQVGSIGGDAADLWFANDMGFSANGRKRYGEPLGKMKIGDIVLMYQNGKGYVGIGKVFEEWDGRGYRDQIVYKDTKFKEYRIPIRWFHDARSNPFDIGYTSAGFLARVRQPKLLARVKQVVSDRTNGETGPMPPLQADADYKPNKEDHRDRILRQIRERRGQQNFRNALITRYGPRCQFTGCEIVDVVEAAHISRYLGEKDNVPANGLLLRADIHTLFDLHLIGINPKSLEVVCTEGVADAYGKQLVGRKLICPDGVMPSPKALQERFRKFKHPGMQ